MDDSEQLVPRISVVAVDCADPRKVGAFWQELLGGTLSEDDEGVVELRGGPIGLDFVHVPEPKRAKNRLHLDLAVPYAVRAQAIDRALALGATRADDLYDSGHWQVLRDPEANEFCLVWGGQL